MYCLLMPFCFCAEVAICDTMNDLAISVFSLESSTASKESHTTGLLRISASRIGTADSSMCYTSLAQQVQYLFSNEVLQTIMMVVHDSGHYLLDVVCFVKNTEEVL